ncbi:Sodium/hydrogen exchanger family [Propionibacterium ruminifibrarum]|uniref:Sodium/hydrogen exchanger family n=1 Tax=Propionibacterium ruminifibrarum TaxID=1962131 RepID=A0A375I1D9_9ACTN|nr:sodium:proton antiporter [Propionibacterium ruminifibrarum]SPF67468.1 Sodium/hydrogen exchanger family [Propionibacterium ruminifibrarum]
MDVVLLIGVAALFVIALSDRLAEWAGLVAPVVLLVLGTGVATIPAVPALHADPDIILQLILPGFLYASAVRMPLLEFRRNLGPIAALSVLLVIATAVAVGLVLHAIVPGLGLAAAIALGAIVSPTDAVATSITRKAGVSQRVISVLEGEGLVNDASALVVMSSALVATTGQVTAGQVVGSFFWAVISAVVVGLIVGNEVLWLRARSSSVTTDMLMSLATPYAAFLLVEHIGGSGLIAAVVCGLVEGYRSTSLLTPSQRSANRTTWAEISLVLESSVFLLMGLQLPAALADDEQAPLGRILVLSVIVIAVVLAARACVVALMLVVARRHAARRARRTSTVRTLMGAHHRDRPERPVTRRQRRRAAWLALRMERALADIDYYTQERLGAREGATIVWAGMRGAVTVAAAQTLPTDLPGRPVMILIAFFVASISLVAQGGSLGAFVRLVRPAQAARASAQERAELREIMHEAAARVPPPAELREAGAGRGATILDADENDESALVTRAENLLGRARTGRLSSQDRHLAGVAGEHALRAVKAQRETLLRVNQTGKYSPAGLTAMLRLLDADQTSLELRMQMYREEQ